MRLPISDPKTMLRCITGALIMVFAASAVNAAPIVAVDLDINQPGVQSTRTVALNQEFRINLVLINPDPLPLLFNNLVIEVFLNDTPPGNDVLTFGSPIELPTAGSLAGLAGTVVDAFTGTPVIPGTPLSLQTPSPPPSPYRLASGRAGMTAVGGTFSLAAGGSAIIAQGKTASGIVAASLGTSHVLAANLPLGTGAELSLNGTPIVVTTQTGTVTVVPEPVTWLLFVSGALGLAARRRCG